MDLANSAFDLKNNVVDTVNVPAKAASAAQTGLDLANSSFDLLNNIKGLFGSDEEKTSKPAPAAETPSTAETSAPASSEETTLAPAAPVQQTAASVASTDGPIE